MSTDATNFLDFLNVDDPSFSEGDQSSNSWAFQQSPVKVEDETWNKILNGTANPLVMAIPDDEQVHDPGFNFSMLQGANEDGIVIPGGLSQISMSTATSASSRSTTPGDETIAMPGALPSVLNPCTPESSYSITPAKVLQQQQQAPPTSPPRSSKQGPHPCAISPHTTAALFTRASSVSSNGSGAPPKKSRAPPSGPISTKDFIPPDVSGLNKREARLVKNRAAAFLSRQRKREEFEGLEARVEVLEADNARLYRELEAHKSGAAPSSSSSDSSSPSTGALTAELAGLKRQLASRDVELSNLHTRIRSLVAAQEATTAEKEAALQQVRELKQQSAGPNAGKKVVEEDSDDEEQMQLSSSMKSAGSVAAMVLMFSLSTLLSQGSSKSGTTSTPPKPMPSSTVRPHHGRSESLSTTLFDPYNYDNMLSTPFGFDEDSLMGSSSRSFTAQQQPQPENAITSVKSTGPDSFEFDFQADKTNGKKIKVCVKSAVPLNLDHDVLPNSNSFGDDLDAPSFPPQQQLGLGKRKRVMLEINPSVTKTGKNARRKIDEDRWDVFVNEEMMEDSDEDVLMA